MNHKNQTIAGLIVGMVLAGTVRAQTVPPEPKKQITDVPSPMLPQSIVWETPAERPHGLIGAASGTLRIDLQGISFLPKNGATMHWSFIEIKDLDLQEHRLDVVGYDNRKWPLAGTRRVELKFKNEMTPAVAASLTAKIDRPVRDGIPDPDASATSVIAVRRSKHFGGSNGLLRIRQQGIDYVTTKSGQSRSWRWLDIQTLSNPDPYHLILFGYRDNYAFDLKETLSRDVFNRLSDEIWTHNEGEMRDHPVTLPPGTPINSGRREDE